MFDTVRVSLGTSKDILAGLLSDGRGWILLAVALGWFFSLGVRLVFPALLPMLREVYGMSISLGSFLITILWLAYAVGQVPGGVLSDRIGSGVVLVGSCLLSAGVLVVIIWTDSLLGLFVATALLGFSTAWFGVTFLSLLSDIYPERSGTAIGLTLATGNIGNSVLPPAVVFLAGLVSWRFGIGTLVLPFALLGVALWVVIPHGKINSSSAVDTASRESLRYVWRGVTERTVLLLLLIQILVVFTYHGFMGMYPTYLIESKGLSAQAATLLFGLFFGLAVLVQPLSGSLADAIGERYTLIGVIAATCLSLVLLPFASGLVVLTGLTVALSVQHGRGVVAITYLTHELPDDMKGTGLGIIRTGYLFSGAVGPITLGLFADFGYFDTGFLFFGFMAFLGMVLCFLLPKPR